MILIKIPFSAGSLGKNSGCCLAPHAVLNSLMSCKDIIRKIGIVDVDQTNIALSQQRIFEHIKRLQEAGMRRLVVIGGDHSITYPSFKAFVSMNNSAGLLVMDAHPDAEPRLKEPTHEDFVRALIEDRIISPEKLILFGLRAKSKKEAAFLKAHGIRIFTADRIFDIGIRNACDAVMEAVHRWPALYLSIDIDVVDPAFAPGTHYKEPGGLSSVELLYAIQRFSKLRNLRMVDIVEINPSKDIADLTIKLGATVIEKLVDGLKLIELKNSQ